MTDTSGTVTLLAADGSFGLSKFKDEIPYGALDQRPEDPVYSTSDVKAYLDSIVAGTAGAGKPDFSAVADAIVPVDLDDVGVTGAKLYLLDTTTANSLPVTRDLLLYMFPDTYVGEGFEGIPSEEGWGVSHYLLRLSAYGQAIRGADAGD